MCRVFVEEIFLIGRAHLKKKCLVFELCAI